MKRLSLIILTLLLITTLTIGCGNDSAKEYALKHIKQQQEIETMSFDGNIKLNLDLSDVINNNEAASYFQSYLQFLSALEFEITGKEAVDPMHSEMNIKAKTNLEGMEFAYDLPIIINENVMYLKPGQLGALLPMDGKEYLMVDLSESATEIDQETTLKDSIALVNSIVNSIDEAAFSKGNPKDFTLASGKASEVVNVSITQENIKPILEGLYNNSLPLFLEQLDKYSASGEQLGQDEQIKEKLNIEKAEFDKFISELDSKLTINDFTITSVYDEEGFQRKIIIDGDIIITTTELGQIPLKINYDFNINDINQKIEFEMPIPAQENVINVKEFEEMTSTY